MLLLLLLILSVSTKHIYDGPLTLYLAYREGFPLEEADQSLGALHQTLFNEQGSRSLTTQHAAVKPQWCKTPTEQAPENVQGSRSLYQQSSIRNQGAKNISLPKKEQGSRNLSAQTALENVQKTRNLSAQPTGNIGQRSKNVTALPDPVRGNESKSLVSRPEEQRKRNGSAQLVAENDLESGNCSEVTDQDSRNSAYQVKSEEEGRRMLAPKADWTLPSDKHYPFCGTRRNPLSRIVGGINAKKASWPWIAALGYMNGREIKFLCGGTLITEKHVLTAAHCLNSVWPLKSVLLGATEIRSMSGQGTGLFPIATKHAHEQYIPETHENDIAILTLGFPITYSGRIKPVCLPLSTTFLSNDYSSHMAKVAGWGATTWGGEGTAKLQELSIPVIGINNCNWVKKEGGVIDKRFLCAGYLNGTKDACKGDSGGPLIWEDRGIAYLVGIVSYGYKCAEAKYPGVYIKVVDYLDWIFKTLQYPRP